MYFGDSNWWVLYVWQLNVEYGGVKGAAAEPSSNAKAAVQNQAQQASAPSNALALPGIPSFCRLRTLCNWIGELIQNTNYLMGEPFSL